MKFLSILREGHSNSEVQGSLILEGNNAISRFAIMQGTPGNAALGKSHVSFLPPLTQQGNLRKIWQSDCGGFEVFPRGSNPIFPAYMGCDSSLFLVKI